MRPSGAATGGTPGEPTSPLTEHGERDARRLAPRLAGFDFALVLCSPLSRARRTAELAGLDPVTDDDLVEWDYGDYEGRTTTRDPRAASATRAGRCSATAWCRRHPGRDGRGGRRPGVAGAGPGGASRCERGDVALVAHGHLLRILAATYLRQDARFGAHLLLDAGAVCVLDHERGVPAVRSWNETAG